MRGMRYFSVVRIAFCLTVAPVFSFRHVICLDEVHFLQCLFSSAAINEIYFMRLMFIIC